MRRLLIWPVAAVVVASPAAQQPAAAPREAGRIDAVMRPRGIQEAGCWSTMYMRFPDDGVTVLVFVNASRGPGDAAHAAARIALG